MTKFPLLIKRANGRVESTGLPNERVGIFQMAIGTSNMLGYEAPFDPALNTYRSDIVVTGENYRVAPHIMYYNWRPSSEQDAIGTAAGERNELRANSVTPQIDYDQFSADLGFANGAIGGALALSPHWSLGAELTMYYETRTRRTVPFTNAAAAQFPFWVLHAAPGATAHQSGGASFHPNAGTSILYDNLTGNFDNARTTANAAALTVEYFDTLYMDLGSADASDAAGFEDGPYSFAGNTLEIVTSLADHIGIPANEMNVVLSEPIEGPYGIDRVEALRREFNRVTSVLPQVKLVMTHDLPRSGDVHLTPRGYVKLGQRMAAARTANPDAVIHELS